MTDAVRGSEDNHNILPQESPGRRGGRRTPQALACCVHAWAERIGCCAVGWILGEIEKVRAQASRCRRIARREPTTPAKLFKQRSSHPAQWGRIRTLPAPLESVSYRFYVACAAMSASDATDHCPPLPAGSLSVRTSLVSEDGRSKPCTRKASSRLVAFDIGVKADVSRSSIIGDHDSNATRYAECVDPCNGRYVRPLEKGRTLGFG